MAGASKPNLTNLAVKNALLSNAILEKARKYTAKQAREAKLGILEPKWRHGQFGWAGCAHYFVFDTDSFTLVGLIPASDGHDDQIGPVI